MPSTEVRWEITYESLAALEESQAWKNWPAVEANGFTTLFAYGPDGRMATGAWYGIPPKTCAARCVRTWAAVSRLR